MKILTIVVLALILTGCSSFRFISDAATNKTDALIDELQDASAKITKRARDWDCKHISIREWQLQHPTEDHKEAWITRCEGSIITP